MIKSFILGAKRIFGNPFLLLPGLAAIAVLLGLLFVFSPFLISIIVNALFLGIVPDAPLNELPFMFLSLYSIDLLGAAAFAFLSGILFALVNYFYAVHARMVSNGNASVGKAFSETVSSIGKIVLFGGFIAIVATGFLAAVWAVGLILLAIPILGAFLLVLLGLGIVYAYVKLVFVVQALAMEQGTIKQAFQQSWAFSTNRFFSVFLVVFILGIINNLVFSAGEVLSLAIVNDIVGIAIIGLAWAVSLAYSGIVMALYYGEKKLGH